MPDWGNLMLIDESRFTLLPDDKRLRIWKEVDACNRSQNINEHISRWKHLLWAEIALGYLTELHIITQHTIMAIQCLDEVIDTIVKLYVIAVCAVFILMGDIVCPHWSIAGEWEDCAYEAASIFTRTYSIANLWDVLSNVVS